MFLPLFQQERAAVIGIGVQAVSCWEAVEGMCVLNEIGGGLFWRPAGTLYVLFCLTMDLTAGVARPSSGDRWSFLEMGHSTVVSLRLALLQPPRTNTSPSVGKILKLQPARPL